MKRKDKLQLFRQLHDEKQAEKDLKLLTDHCPLHKDIDRFSRNPRYYASHILYALLDVCSQEEIIRNREPLEGNGSSNTSTEDGVDSGSSETLTEHDAPDGSSKTLSDDKAKTSSDDDGKNTTGPAASPEGSKKKRSKKKQNTPT